MNSKAGGRMFRFGSEEEFGTKYKTTSMGIDGLIEEIESNYLTEVNIANQSDMLVVGAMNRQNDKENRPGNSRLIDKLSNLIKYLGQAKLRGERELEKRAESYRSEYEANIQKLEAKVRENIRIEQQLRLYIEDVKFKLEDATKKAVKYEEESVKLAKERDLLKEKLASRSNTENREKEHREKRADSKLHSRDKNASRYIHTGINGHSSHNYYQNMVGGSAGLLGLPYHGHTSSIAADRSKNVVKGLEKVVAKEKAKKASQVQARPKETEDKEKTEFGRLLKRVTSALLTKGAQPSRPKRRPKNSSVAIDMSDSLNSSNRTHEHILEMSGYSVEKKRQRSTTKKYTSEYGQRGHHLR